MERKDVKALLPPPQRHDDLEETEPDPEDEAGVEAEAFITDEQGRRRRLKEGELETIAAEGHKRVMAVWREIECFTDALIDVDANLAQRLFAILRDDVDIEGRSARDVLTEALEFGLKLATQRAPGIPSEITPEKSRPPFKGS